MRDYVISATLLALAGLALPYASLGLVVYYWISFMSIQNLMWESTSIRFALIVAASTLLGYLISVTDRRIFWSFPFTVCLSLTAWMCVTTLFAISPGSSVQGFIDYLKIIAMMILTAGIVKSRVTLHALCWIICISIGYYAVKYGAAVVTGSNVFVVRSGINSPILSDTNQLARAFVFIIPILVYLYSQSPWKSVRCTIAVVFILSIMGMVGTNSRGGFVAFACVLGFLCWQGRRKVSMILIGGVIVFIAISIVPSERWEFWSDRINTIESYEDDPSFQVRVVQWKYAIELADARLTGGGFLSDLLPTRYDGGAREPRAYHSNYFEMLGDHGWPGLALYIMLLISTWRLGSAVMSQTRNHPDLYWAHDLATMIKASMVGYAAGGLVIAHAYYEPFYVLVALLTVLKGIVQRQTSGEAPQESRLSAGRGDGSGMRRGWSQGARSS